MRALISRPWPGYFTGIETEECRAMDATVRPLLARVLPHSVFWGVSPRTPVVCNAPGTAFFLFSLWRQRLRRVMRTMAVQILSSDASVSVSPA